MSRLLVKSFIKLLLGAARAVKAEREKAKIRKESAEFLGSVKEHVEHHIKHSFKLTQHPYEEALLLRAIPREEQVIAGKRFSKVICYLTLFCITPQTWIKELYENLEDVSVNDSVLSSLFTKRALEFLQQAPPPHEELEAYILQRTRIMNALKEIYINPPSLRKYIEDESFNKILRAIAFYGPQLALGVQFPYELQEFEKIHLKILYRIFKECVGNLEQQIIEIYGWHFLREIFYCDEPEVNV